MAYNMFSCTGWGEEGTAVLGACSLAWFSFAIILLLILILRRQCEDGLFAGTGFSLVGSLVGGLGANFVLTTLFGSVRWSLIGGVAGLVVGGFLIGKFTGEGY
jgi:hypothetical protein